MEEEYKGWRIWYDEKRRSFMAEHLTDKDAPPRASGDLTILKSMLDNYGKQRQKFAKVACIEIDGFPFRHANITSVVRSTGYYQGANLTDRKEDVEVRITITEGGQWHGQKDTKLLHELIPDTPGNRDKVKEIERLQSEAKGIQASFERFDLKEFQKRLQD